MKRLYKVNMTSSGEVIPYPVGDGTVYERAAVALRWDAPPDDPRRLYDLSPSLDRLFADTPDRFSFTHRFGTDETYLSFTIDWAAYNASSGLILVHGQQPISATLVLSDADRVADNDALTAFVGQVAGMTTITDDHVRRVCRRLRIPPFVLTVSLNGYRDATIEMTEVDTARAFLRLKGIM
jgi:hypothetical protein